MQTRREPRRKFHSEVLNMLSPWVLYYIIGLVSFVSSFYVNFTVLPPFGYVRDPRLICFIVFSFIFMVMYITSPRVIIDHDDNYKMVMAKRIFEVALIFDLLFLGLFMLFCTYEIASLLIVITIFLQGVFFVEIVLVLLEESLNKRPVEAFWSVQVSVMQTGASPSIVFPILSQISPFIYQFVFTWLIFMVSVPSVSNYRVVSSLVQILFLVWTHHVFINFLIGWFSISCMMKITSPSIVTHPKIVLKILGRNAERAGTFVYLALVSVVLEVFESLKTVFLYRLWPKEVREKTKGALKNIFRSWYQYYTYRVDTITVVSTVFGVSPHEAGQMVGDLMNQSEIFSSSGLLSISSTETTRLLSHYIVLVILIPAGLLMFFWRTKMPQNEEVYLKIFISLLWCTYSLPSLGYIYTETIHRCILLSHSKQINMSIGWVENYLFNFQI